MLVITAKIFKYEGAAAWYFISTSKEEAVEIRTHQKKTVGWKSVPVRVTLGDSTWDTSFFPTKQGPYLLPIKAGIRNKENVDEGDLVRIKVAFV